MIFKAPDRLAAFHDRAIAQDIPADDVERWLAIARPCATLVLNENGPVVGRLGGPLLLPEDTPDPAHPLVASIDLAALPSGVTDLPLPADGHLLLFAYPDEDMDDNSDNLGSVVHVPAGATVVEREERVGLEYDPYRGTTRHIPQGPLVAVADMSLPYHHLARFPEKPRIRHLPGHPRAEELVDAWDAICRDVDIWGSLQIGGYSNQEAVGTDPVADAVPAALREVEKSRMDGPVSSDVADWVLLADWHLDIAGLEGASVHWSIQREDLAEWRFDRVITTMFWNP
ncbi:DUF1963 domain-containing protein [Umezawaea endophytica]|uniref:DUF1963 domain-containing protein n=1 Tax=Umezawaea endophytica TaxID=1654476 RepID=A0A9X2VTI2_9PSEU|nr:DUF1963 domain-containing protein [Umezawaea endophytica]MCS7482538.1 DUF1963 domain-containing protein [Umezawaea endophytica]